MKRIVSCLLSVFLLLPLIACTSPELPQKVPETDPNATSAITTEPPETEPPVEYGTWDDDGVLRILTVGNSFSDDAMEYVYHIATNLGIEKVELGNLYIGGCSLDTHYANLKGNYAAYTYRVNVDGTWNSTPGTTAESAIRQRDWDYISLQQSSGVSGVAASYGKLEPLIDEVLRISRESGNDDVSLVWHATWAYQGDSTHASFPTYGKDQMTMYRAIQDVVQNTVMPTGAFDRVIPSGTAIQNARSSFVGDKLTADGYHLTHDLGRYIAGVTLVHALTGYDIKSLSYLPDALASGPNADFYLAMIIESAENAVRTSDAVTDSKYKTIPELDLSGYEEISYEITPLAYYNSPVGSVLYDQAGNSHQFYATELFCRETLPVGSLIVIAEGWQYRPEAFPYNGNRPALVSTSVIRVSEGWWGEYESRGFNVCTMKLDSLREMDAEARQALKIYIPKSAQ